MSDDKHLQSDDEADLPEDEIDEKVVPIEGLEDLESAFESEKVRDLSDSVYYESLKSFWQEVQPGLWYPRTEKQLRRYLERVGLRKDKRKIKGKLEPLSQIDEFLEKCERKHRVFYAGPLAGHRAGFTMMNGTPILVTEELNLMEPRKPTAEMVEADPDHPGWSMVAKVLYGLLDDAESEIDQSTYFHGHTKHALDCLHDGYPEGGLAMALVGPPKSGKSLLTDMLQAMYGGKVARPYEYMIGKDNFNEEMSESFFWIIDDETVSTKMQDRVKFGSEVKKIVANSGIRFRGLNKKAITLKIGARLYICTNEGPDDIQVLPPLGQETGVDDKIMVLKVYKRPMPMPAGTPKDRRVFWETLMRELPYYVWWLRNEFKLPSWAQKTEGRWEVDPYKHPSIVGDLYSLSTEAVLWEVIEKSIFEDDERQPIHFPKFPDIKELPQGMVMLSAAEIIRGLKEDDNLSPDEKRVVPSSPGWMGKRLNALWEHHGSTRLYKGMKRDKSGRLWVLMKEGLWDVYFSDSADSMDSRLKDAVHSYLVEEKQVKE